MSAFGTMIAGGGLGLVCDQRMAQIAEGHTPAADALLPLHTLPDKAKDYLIIALEELREFRGPCDMPRARKKLAQAAALLIAALDRLPPEEADAR